MVLGTTVTSGQKFYRLMRMLLLKKQPSLQSIRCPQRLWMLSLAQDLKKKFSPWVASDPRQNRLERSEAEMPRSTPSFVTAG